MMKRRPWKKSLGRAFRRMLCCAAIGLFSLSVFADIVEEDYTFTASEGTKTVHIQWDVDAVQTWCRDGDSPDILKSSLRRSLFDEGMFEDYVGTDTLSGESEFSTLVRYEGSGIERYCFSVHYKANDPFAVLCGRPGTDMGDSFSKMQQIAAYWDARPGTALPIPRPRSWGHLEPVAPETTARDFMTVEFIEGPDRVGFVDQLFGDTPLSWDDALDLTARTEVRDLTKIWLALDDDYMLVDLHAKNVLFASEKSGQVVSKYVDISQFEPVYVFDQYLVETLFDIENSLRHVGGGGGLGTVDTFQEFVGVYDALRQAGMSYTDIKAMFEGISTSVFGSERQKILSLMEQGYTDLKHRVRWLDLDEGVYFPGSMAEFEAEKRALQVAMIEGEYGVHDLLLRKCFPDEYPTVKITGIDAQYAFSTSVRDVYRVFLNQGETVRSALVGISHDRTSNAQSLREEADALRKALVERGADFVPQGGGSRPVFEFETPQGVVEEIGFVAHQDWGEAVSAEAELVHVNRQLAGALSDEQRVALEAERQAILEAQTWVFCQLYETTISPLSGEGLSGPYQRCVLGYPNRMMIEQRGPGSYRAAPIDLANVITGLSPAEFVDYYARAASSVHGSLEGLATYIDTIADALGADFLREAQESVRSADVRAMIDIRLMERALEGKDIIEAIVYEERGASGQLNYQELLEAEYSRALKGKSVTVEGTTYVLPPRSMTDWTPADARNWMAMVDDALGDEIAVATKPSASNQQVADCIRQLLKQDSDFSALEWDIFEAFGVRKGTDDLMNLLDNLFLETSKGYQLTPRTLLMPCTFFKSSDESLVPSIFDRLEKTEKQGYTTAQPLERLMLTKTTQSELADLLLLNGGEPNIAGTYHSTIHALICGDTSTLLHEMSHADMRATLYAYAAEEGLSRPPDFLAYPEIREWEEGYVQARAEAKLGLLDDFFGEALTGYDMASRPFGFFGLQERAINTYPTLGRDLYLKLLDEGYRYTVSMLRQDTENFRYIEEYAAEAGWASPSSPTVLHDYYRFSVRNRPVELWLYLSAKDEVPLQLSFDNTGKIKVFYPDESGFMKHDLFRAQFRELYGDAEGLFVSPGGATLDLSDISRVIYSRNGYSITLTPYCMLDVVDMDSPLFMVQHKAYIEAFYQGRRVGRLDIYDPSGAGQLHIDEVKVDLSGFGDLPLLSEEELIRAMLLKRYKFWIRQNQLTTITFAPDLIDMDAYVHHTAPADTYPVHQAVQSLIDEGYLADVGLDVDGNLVTRVEESLADAACTISSEGKIANIVIGGTVQNPSLTAGGETLIDAGLLAAEGGVKIDYSERMLQFKIGPDGDIWEVSLDTLLDLAEARFGTRTFVFKAASGMDLISLMPEGMQVGNLPLQAPAYLKVGQSFNCYLVPLPQSWFMDVSYDSSECMRQFLNIRGAGELRNMELVEARYAMEEGRWKVKVVSHVEGGRGIGLEVSWENFLRAIEQTEGGNEMILQGSGGELTSIRFTETPGKVEFWGDLIKDKRRNVINERIYQSYTLGERLADARAYKTVNQGWDGMKDVVFCEKTTGFYPKKGGMVEISGVTRPKAGSPLSRVVDYEIFVLDSKGQVLYVAKEGVTEATWSGRVLESTARALSTPLGTGIFVGGLNVLAIGINGYSGEYVREDHERLKSDILYGAVDTTYWMGSVKVLNAFKNVRLLAAGGGLTMLPVMAAGHTLASYAEALYVEHDRVEELELGDAGESLLYRAWLSMVSDLDQKYLQDQVMPMNDAEEQIVAWPVADSIFYEKYGMFYSDTNVTSAQVAWFEDIAFKTGMKYAEMFLEEILEPLNRGLCWSADSGFPDEYGSLRTWRFVDTYDSAYPLSETPNYMLGAGPAPLGTNAVDLICDRLIQGMANLWYKWNGGSGFEPISAHMDYMPDIDKIRSMTIGAVESLGQQCAAYVQLQSENPYEFAGISGEWIGESWAPYRYYWQPTDVFTLGLSSVRWFDCRTTALMCEEIAEELMQRDPPVVAAINVSDHFETPPADGGLTSYVQEDTSSSTYTVSSDETLPGVRYYWDVQAHNAIGSSPDSEQRSFITK